MNSSLQNIWSDHNLHDPGITLLEHLAYAISDLEYRLGFDMEDLLQVRRKHQGKRFFNAREIMPMSPLTVNDYRKMLIDLKGVRNAWLEQTDGTPGFDYHRESGELTLHSGGQNGLFPKGFYHIKIEKEAGYSEAEVRAAMMCHRNLCEDVGAIEALEEEKIYVSVQVETREGVIISALQNKIEQVLAEWVSPSLRFYSLAEMLARGKTPEAIFQGPLLEHGFIDDDELAAHRHRTALRTSDILHLLMDLPEIKVVQKVQIWSTNPAKPETQYLPLQPGKTPRLHELQISVWRLGRAVPVATATNILLPPSNKNAGNGAGDLPLPAGRYKGSGKYYSITRDFPQNYGIGEAGLPAAADDQRRAQARQFKAYLAVFEQILGNYFAQLGHIPDLFSPHYHERGSYFPKVLHSRNGVPEYFSLLDRLRYHVHRLKSYLEDEGLALNRLQRQVDHLLAYFAERFPALTNYNLDHPTQGGFGWKNLEAKRRFLAGYNSVSSKRAEAYNYSIQSEALKSRNVSGLEKRLRLLLNLKPWRMGGINKDDVFYLVEHNSLRPRLDSVKPTFSAAWIPFLHTMIIEKAYEGFNLRCTKNSEYGLKIGDRIRILKSDMYDGFYNIFDITDNFIFVNSEPGIWHEESSPYIEVQWSLLNPNFCDPWSLQLSFVFPGWGQFIDPEYRKQVEKIVLQETPVHLTPYVHWMTRENIGLFESNYRELRKNTAQGIYPAQAVATLNEMLLISKMIDVGKSKRKLAKR